MPKFEQVNITHLLVHLSLTKPFKVQYRFSCELNKE